MSVARWPTRSEHRADAGIGYAIQERTRAPRYVRLAFVTDSEIDDLMDFVRDGQSLPRVGAT